MTLIRSSCTCTRPWVRRRRKLIGNRTREALQALKRKGVKLGNPTSLPVAQRLGADAMKTKADAFAHSGYR